MLQPEPNNTSNEPAIEPRPEDAPAVALSEQVKRQMEELGYLDYGRDI